MLLYFKEGEILGFLLFNAIIFTSNQLKIVCRIAEIKLKNKLGLYGFLKEFFFIFSWSISTNVLKNPLKVLWKSRG